MKKKRIVLAGGSGFCGRILSTHLTENGWDVVVLTRHPKSFFRIAREVKWDAQTLGEWQTELNGADAVINLTGRSVNCRYTPENRRLILESRVFSTRVIGKAIAACKHPPATWLNTSTATIYKHSFQKDLDENGEIAGDKDAKDEFSVQVGQEWEAALDGADVPQTRKIPMRMAMILSPEQNTVYRVLRRLARLGLGGTLASGRQYVGWIHHVDFCRAVDFLLTNPDLVGPFNVASPHPVTNREMMKSLRETVHVPFGLPASAWMMEIGAFILRTETELMLKSRRVVPGKLLSAGFKFQFPDIEGAFAEIEKHI